jgi:uncharacterized protein (DUF1330 family)
VPACLIADVQVTDPAAYEPYRSLVAASIARFGVRFMVRGGWVELLEGEPQPELIVGIEFPDAGMAHRWYRSEEYRRALKIRQSTSRGRLLLVEGRVSGYSWRAGRRPNSTTAALGSQPPPVR